MYVLIEVRHLNYVLIDHIWILLNQDVIVSMDQVHDLLINDKDFLFDLILFDEEHFQFLSWILYVHLSCFLSIDLMSKWFVCFFLRRKKFFTWSDVVILLSDVIKFSKDLSILINGSDDFDNGFSRDFNFDWNSSTLKEKKDNKMKRKYLIFTIWRNILLLEIDEDDGSLGIFVGVCCTEVGVLKPIVFIGFERSSFNGLFVVCKGCELKLKWLAIVISFDWVVVVGVDIKSDNENPFVDDTRYKNELEEKKKNLYDSLDKKLI